MFLNKNLFWLLIIYLLVVQGCKPNNSDEEFSDLTTKKDIFIFKKDLKWLNLDKPLDETFLIHKFKLLFFFRVNDVSSLNQINYLNKISQKYKELTVIGIHNPKFLYEKDNNHVKNLLSLENYQFPIINDLEYEIWNKFEIRSWTSFVLLDPKGNICGRFNSNNIANELERIVEDKITQYKKHSIIDSSTLHYTIFQPEFSNHILYKPSAMAFDARSQTLFIADTYHHRIIASDTMGHIKYVIGNGIKGNKQGRYELSELNAPSYLYIDSKSNLLYVTESSSNSIRVVNLSSQTVNQFLPNNIYKYTNLKNEKVNHQLNYPLALTKYFDHLIYANVGSEYLVKINEKEKQLQLILGNGSSGNVDSIYNNACLAYTSSMEIYKSNLYFIDKESSSLRYWNGKNVYTLIGKGIFDFGLKDGNKTKALMQSPQALAFFNTKLYITDTYNAKLRYYQLQDSQLYTIPDSGFLSNKLPYGICAVGHKIFISDILTNQIYIYNDIENRFSTFKLQNLSKLSYSNHTNIMLGIESGFYIKPKKGFIYLTFDTSEYMKIVKDELNSIEVFSNDSSKILLGKPIFSDKKVSIKIPYISKSDQSSILIKYTLYTQNLKTGNFDVCTNEIKYFIKESLDKKLTSTPTLVPIH